MNSADPFPQLLAGGMGMGDIVGRLRGAAPFSDDGPALFEAADEIERMRRGFTSAFISEEWGYQVRSTEPDLASHLGPNVQPNEDAARRRAATSIFKGFVVKRLVTKWEQA